MLIYIYIYIIICTHLCYICGMYPPQHVHSHTHVHSGTDIDLQVYMYILLHVSHMLLTNLPTSPHSANLSYHPCHDCSFRLTTTVRLDIAGAGCRKYEKYRKMIKS